MPLYVYNSKKNDKGKHEVHKYSCKHVPDFINISMIGYANDCYEAIQKAREQTGHNHFDGCFFCCRDCHQEEEEES